MFVKKEVTALSRERTNLKSGRFLVIIPAILSIIILWYHYHVPGLSTDGVVYLQIARNILSGIGLGWQALWFPPLHSVLIAAVSYLTGIKDLLAVAGIVAPFMGFLLVLAVYFLASQLFDRRTALIASVLSALFPHLINFSFSPEAEITYTSFLVLSLALYVASIRRNSHCFAVLAGLSFALAYLARSEGFVIMALVFSVTTAVQGQRFYRSKVFKLSATATVLFFLAASPYLVFLKKHYGTWVISPKTSYVMSWMKSRIYHDNDKGEIFNDELWGLNSAGKLRWQEPKGTGELAEYLISNPTKNLSVYMHNLSMEIPGRIPNGSGMEHYPQVYPLYLALAALFAVFGRWGEYSREKKCVLLSPFIILLILPIFTEGWCKYLVPYLPLLIITASWGFTVITDMVFKKILGINDEKMQAVCIAILVCIVASRFIFALQAKSETPISQYKQFRAEYPAEAKKAGEWAVSKFGAGKNYMVIWCKLVYYLNGSWTPEPVAGINETLKFAKANKVDYVVKEMIGGDYAAEEIMTPPAGLQYVGLYKSSERQYAIAYYRLSK